MKNIVFLCFLVLIVIFSMGCIGNNEISNDFECKTAEDCVPAQCCHPTECVHIDLAPDCTDVFCTMECRPETMDCGQGYCDCVEGDCVAIIDSPMN